MDLESCAQTVNQTTDIYLVDAGQNATAMLRDAWKRAEKEGKLEELAHIRESDKPVSEPSCLILLLSLLISLIGKELLSRDFKTTKDGGIWKGDLPEDKKPVKEEKEVKEEEYTNPIDKVPNDYLVTALQYAVKKMNEYYDKAKVTGDQSEEHAMAIAFDMLVQFCDKELTAREKKNDTTETAS